MAEAAEEFQTFLEMNPGQTLLVFDFDGTLSEIVPNPPDARIVEASADAIDRLAARGVRVGVISGRPAATLLELSGARTRAGLGRAIIFGHYGAERLDLETGTESFPTPPKGVSQAKVALASIAQRYSGAYLEDKGLAVALHLRQSPNPAEAFEEVESEVRSIAREAGLDVEPGRYVWELRAADSDKGQALTALIDELAPKAVMFAGDDLGDVPAFTALAESHIPEVKCAVVSASPEAPEVRDFADVLCAGPSGVASWLWHLANLAEDRHS